MNDPTRSADATIRSLNARQDVTSPFTISFTYQAPNLTSYNPQGLLLVLQNDTDGANAVGFANGSSTLGFTNISPSIASAIYLDPDDFTSTGIFRNGTIGSGLTTTAPVNAFDGQPINVTLAYDGSSFALTMSENGVTYSPSPYLVGSLASSLGSSTAYVGFTAYTGAGVSDNVTARANFVSNDPPSPLSNFRFTSGVPEPTTAATLVGGAGLLALRRRRAGAAL